MKAIKNYARKSDATKLVNKLGPNSHRIIKKRDGTFNVVADGIAQTTERTLKSDSDPKLKNRIRRTGFSGAVLAVWDLCDKLANKHGEDFRRKHVMDAGEKAGIAYFTVRTQYQSWKQAGGLDDALKQLG